MAKWDAAANAIFLQALEFESSEQRRAYLDNACADDAELRAEVESLLAARSQVGTFLEHPAPGLVTTLEARVPGTLRHGARVSRIASAIGRRMGLSAESIERMQRGAVLHDIGGQRDALAAVGLAQPLRRGVARRRLA